LGAQVGIERLHENACHIGITDRASHTSFSSSSPPNNRCSVYGTKTIEIMLSKNTAKSGVEPLASCSIAEETVLKLQQTKFYVCN
jgi:hypothetical protein